VVSKWVKGHARLGPNERCDALVRFEIASTVKQLRQLGS